MKKVVIFSLSMILTVTLFVQSNAQEKASPEFKGDQEISSIRKTDAVTLVNNYLFKNVKCPKSAAECCKEGTEIVQFTVSETGNVSEFIVINSVCSELDKEVIRVLKTTNGMWKPAVKNGEPVAMTKEVAFMFGDQDRSAIVNYFVKAASRHYKNAGKNLFVRNKPQKALNNLNMGINYMPNDKALLVMRGLCLYELGEIASAERDWNRVIDLGGVAQGVNLDELAEMKGYKDMTRILAAKDKN